MTELQIIKASMDKALTLEDLFGVFVGTKREIEKSLRSTFAHLSRAVHPDFNAEEPQAAETFAELSGFYDLAKKSVEAGTWGKKLPIPGREQVTIAGKYTRIRSFATGDMADIHLGKMGDAPILIKAARLAFDNDLLLAEQRNLGALREKMIKRDSRLIIGIPEVFDSVLISEGTSLKRRVNIISASPGYCTGTELLRLIPEGVDGKTIVWMWKRVMKFIDWIYHAGFIHGAVLPQHILFYPDNDGNNHDDPRKHSIRLIDWCYSIEHKSRTRLSSWCPQSKDFYAPEIPAKQPLGPSTDLYMAAKTMIFLSGGDVAKNILSPKIPKPLADSILACVHPDPAKRPASAGDHFDAFLAVQKAVFGAPKWHDLNIPGGPAQLDL